MLLTLAWRNIWRNRNRSLITMASIASAVLLAVLTAALQKGVFDNLIHNVVSLYTGHMQIHEKGYWDEQILDNAFLMNDTLEQQVNQLEELIAAAPRLETFSLISSGEKTKGALVIGVAPEAENRLTNLQGKLVKGDFLKENDKNALLAEGLAEKLKVVVGDTIVLLAQGFYGSTAAGKFAIGGLLHFGSPELNGQVVYLSLPTAQTWLDAPGMATTLALTIRNDDALHQTAADLKNILPAHYEVLTWEDMMPEIVQHIKTDTVGMYIMIGVLYLIIAFGIFSTLLMMLAERQREFGMLVSLGMQKFKIARMLLVESVLLTLFGCLAGVALSLPATWYLTVHPIKFTGELAKVYEQFGFEAIFPATMDPAIFINQTLVVLVLGLVLSMYPVLKLLKLDPVAAMRR
mgnify:CR=1 FL=1